MTEAAPLCGSRMLVAISDFCDGWPPAIDGGPDVAAAAEAWRSGANGPAPAAATGTASRGTPVRGGYLERLPLACVSAGLVERAEIWTHWRSADAAPHRQETPVLARRAFRLSDDRPPFRSNSMMGFVRAFGAPHILCVWGLGVDPALLRACARSFKIYNSIDVPPLRVPPDVSAEFDLILTGADWQSADIRSRHPAMTCAVMPIGPEFADPETFRPLGIEKPYDVVYVAAAQTYKRHDLLFDALARAPRPLKALCVFGYGELGDELRRRAADQRLDVDFIGPPGVDFAEVNRLMNQARIGVVCGSDDGAPAILTEYMLAGLPVLANAGLRCGLNFITPETGLAAGPDHFLDGLLSLLSAADGMRPRETVLSRWTWPHTVRRLAGLMAENPKARGLGLRQDAAPL